MERRLQWPLLVAALLVVPTIVIEQSDVGQPWDTIALVINWATWLAFMAKAALMFRVWTTVGAGCGSIPLKWRSWSSRRRTASPKHSG
jgi:hypothetical protein